MNEWGQIKITVEALSSWDGLSVYLKDEEPWLLIREAFGAVRSGFAELIAREWRPIVEPEPEPEPEPIVEPKTETSKRSK